MNNEFHFCYLGLSFCMSVRIGKMICTFQSKHKVCYIIVIWLPSARESRRDFVYLCNKTI